MIIITNLDMATLLLNLSIVMSPPVHTSFKAVVMDAALNMHPHLSKSANAGETTVHNDNECSTDMLFVNTIMEVQIMNLNQ